MGEQNTCFTRCRRITRLGLVEFFGNNLVFCQNIPELLWNHISYNDFNQQTLLLSEKWAYALFFIWFSAVVTIMINDLFIATSAEVVPLL